MTGLCLMALAAALCAGCTSTKVTVEGGKWTMDRRSFLQRLDIPHVTVATNGTAELTGYVNDGGNEALANIIKAAVEAAVKAGKGM